MSDCRHSAPFTSLLMRQVHLQPDLQRMYSRADEAEIVRRHILTRQDEVQLIYFARTAALLSGAPRNGESKGRI